MGGATLYKVYPSVEKAVEALAETMEGRLDAEGNDFDYSLLFFKFADIRPAEKGTGYGLTIRWGK